LEILFRFYSTNEIPVVPQSPTEQIQNILDKSIELSLQAAKLNDKGEYASAESLLEGALALRSKAFEELKKHQEVSKADNEWSFVTAKLQASLAYSKTALGKNEEAITLYENCLPIIETWQKEDRDRGVILSNYAEALYATKKPHDAAQASQLALSILRKHHHDDELIAANLSNLAGYLCAVKKYAEAKPHSAAALKIFIKKLGKKNRFTKDAWSNFYCILKELGQEEEAKDLETDWKTAHEGLSSKHSEKLTDKQILDIRARVEERLYAQKRVEPSGSIKDPKFYREELAKFMDQWKADGLDLEDEAHHTPLKKELFALKRADKHGRSTIERHTERLADIASQHGEDWSNILEELDGIAEQAAAVDEELYSKRMAASAALQEEIATRPKKPAGPTKEMLEELERIKADKKEKARLKAEAEKAAAEAAAKAAAEAAAKGKGKKKR
jgi:hypothetical protein